MRMASKLRSFLLIGGAALALAACTQGEEISSPGATNSGTGTGGSSGGGTGGGGGVACPTGLTCEDDLVGGFRVALLNSNILNDTTLDYHPGVAYRLPGRVDVGIDGGRDCAGGDPAVLTIEPGVVVFGASGSDYIVVNRCSKIIADGTLDMPIIMTSEADLERQEVAAAAGEPFDNGGDESSEWGGLVVLGRAQINRCATGLGTPGMPDCENRVEGVSNPDALYGGGKNDDDNGIIRYVQVRFAGFPLSSGDELNGITFAGTGSDTIVDYVQVHNNSDDGIEMFGGYTNLRHIVLTGNDDESLDTDNGWQGLVQYLLIKQRANGGDNGMEMSSNGAGVGDQTNPTIANFTMVTGSAVGANAFRINSGHIGHFYNGVVEHGNGAQCIEWAGSAGNGVAGYQGGGVDPQFDSVLFDCGAGALGEDDTAAAQDAVDMGANNDDMHMSSVDAMFFPGANEIAGTPFTTLPSVNPWFDDAEYIGAFDPVNETPTDNWAAGWTFALFDPECPDGTVETGVKNGLLVCAISGLQTEDITLTRGNYYEVEGRVDIGVDTGPDGGAVDGDPAVLTIEAGVTMFGNSGSDYIVVNRGSQIMANGTASAPIIMTSEGDIDDPLRDDTDNFGEWGGLVVLGRGQINRCATGLGTPGMDDCQNRVEGVSNPDALYGGDLDTDDSGVIRYVQVKYAGFPLSSGDELNGITFAGTGSGTEVEYVQVHNNADDGIEMFGGFTNLKHIVLTGNDDESLDTDNGWQGLVQFLLIIQRANGGDNGMEMSSNGAGVGDQTNPTIANFTMLSGTPTGANAFRINSGHIGRFINGVVVHDNGQPCIEWAGSAGNAVAGYQGGGVDPMFDSVLIDCNGGGLAEDDTAAAQDAIDMGANNDDAYSDTLVATFINGSAEMAAVEFATPLSTIDPWFEDTDYVGAVKDTSASSRWWAGWTCGLESGSDC